MPRSKATSTADRRRHVPHPRYRFIGGKGGVGKTTCAAALGVASARRGRRTLIISCDPAPSLGDALGQRLGAAPRPVKGVRGLYAVEVDAAKVLARWIGQRRTALEAIALRGTWLDREDVTQLLALSLPGIDEIAGLLEISEIGSRSRYERIIVDTAPTGHLLRMLEMPAVLERIAHLFDQMHAKHRVMVQALRGAWRPDSADVLIEAIDRQAQEMRRLLRDRTHAAVSWVTLPERMSVEETADALRFMRERDITVDTVIVNRRTPPPPQSCRWCEARMREERQAVRDLARRPGLKGVRLLEIPAAEREPRGIAALAAVAAALERPPGVKAPARRSPAGRVTASPPACKAGAPAGPLVTPESRLVMFGGKGGVGKTTCAAAAALEAAAGAPGRRVLLLSTDPAHSVGDAIGQRIPAAGGRVRTGPPNLAVRELDAGRAFDMVRTRFTEAIDRLFRQAADAGAVEAAVARQDWQAMRDLIELAPPGVDELVAVIEVTETLFAGRRSAFELVIMDTAPTGHALRLIEMPGLVHAWVRTLMGILLKYQPVVGVGDLGAVLLRLSQGLSRLRDLMSDPGLTRFIAVTRTGALPRMETVRLLERLDGSGIATPAVLVNAVGAGTCRRCERDRATQRTEIAALRRVLARRRGRPLVLTAPAEIPPPHGVRALRAWIKTWRAGD
jgi:arsenite-transporting ATPase